MRCMKWLTALMTILLGVTLCGTSANAALILHEPFAIGGTPALGQYTATGLTPQNPTITGFTGAWRTQCCGNANVDASGLTYAAPFYLGSSGGKVLSLNGTGGGDSISRNMRNLTTGYTNTTNDTIYMSLLMQLNNTSASPLREFELHFNGDADGNRTLQLGFGSTDFGSSTQFRARINNSGALLQDIGAVNTDVNLFVMKFSLSSVNNADTIRIWMNPSLAQFGDPAGGVLFSGFNFQFDRIAFGDFFFVTGNIAFDELRMGNTFNEVAGSFIPEPASWSLGLIGLAGLGLFAWRRRRVA